MNRNRLLAVSYVGWSFLMSYFACYAADISVSQSLECRVSISGQIVSGDFDRLLLLKDKLVIFDGESTAKSIACLNSPGGSLTEGMKIANFVLTEGVGTRILANNECISICAIIFMMGNARGSEVSGINREMHVTSLLGFHRPYLAINEARAFTSGEVEEAYDFGVSSIVQLMLLANTPIPWGPGQMMEPDLVYRMAGMPGDSIYSITTVDEVIRWKIGITGLPDVQDFRSPHAMFACDNSLTAEVGLTTEMSGGGLMTKDIFALSPLDEFSVQQATHGATWDSKSGRHQVASLRSGYVSVSCEIEYAQGSVAVCGEDQMTDTRVGDCDERYGMRYFPTLVAQHPASSLLALSMIKGNQPDAATIQRCRVYDTSDKLLDDRICLQQVILVSDASGQAARHLVDWPTGARTVVEIGAERYQKESTVRINGQLGQLTKRNGATCVINRESKNTFCLGG